LCGARRLSSCPVVKIVHAADLHIDSPIRGLERYEGAPAAAARLATRRALSALADLCIAQRASLLVLAGDLVDASAHDHKTGLFFVSEMLRLRDAGIQVFSVRGNHDAASRIVPNMLLPDNVVELGLDGPETIVIERLGVAVHGRSYRDRATAENLVAGYPGPIARAVNVGLLHTSADGREGHDVYAPCTVPALREVGYDYWALGHVHAHEVLCVDPPVVFPGNLQGRSMREQGPKGAIVVTVEGSGVVAVELRSLDVIRFCTCEVDISEAETLDDILDAVSRRLAMLLDGDDSEERVFAVRIVLDGVPGIGALLAHAPARCVREIRAVAREVGEARIWVESVQARGRAPVSARWTMRAELPGLWA